MRTHYHFVRGLQGIIPCSTQQIKDNIFGITSFFDEQSSLQTRFWLLCEHPCKFLEVSIIPWGTPKWPACLNNTGPNKLVFEMQNFLFFIWTGIRKINRGCFIAQWDHRLTKGHGCQDVQLTIAAVNRSSCQDTWWYRGHEPLGTAWDVWHSIFLGVLLSFVRQLIAGKFTCSISQRILIISVLWKVLRSTLITGNDKVPCTKKYHNLL